ncbi:hypothetical protein [Gloeobacter violaceus]|uniref:Gll3368 protein n=1 Tax=Gloeobacter violaceus (strain ATCC 29082 / PCC 7421) TaxID=251221 RepID=Q7NG06_GLOVI|nr:hypothetical protein [Gloeobacter violaceus]BAC91309.1 gll3368 [Gloeobacter violaceus PCC 7421]
MSGDEIEKGLQWLFEFLDLSKLGGWKDLIDTLGYLIEKLDWLLAPIAVSLGALLRVWWSGKVLPWLRGLWNTEAAAQRELKALETGLEEAERYYNRPDIWYRLASDFMFAGFWWVMFAVEALTIAIAPPVKTGVLDVIFYTFFVVLLLFGLIWAGARLGDVWVILSRLGRHKEYRKQTQKRIGVLTMKAGLPPTMHSPGAASQKKAKHLELKAWIRARREQPTLPTDGNSTPPK